MKGEDYAFLAYRSNDQSITILSSRSVDLPEGNAAQAISQVYTERRPSYLTPTLPILSVEEAFNGVGFTWFIRTTIYSSYPSGRLLY